MANSVESDLKDVRKKLHGRLLEKYLYRIAYFPRKHLISFFFKCNLETILFILANTVI
jgi:hypothetical protein